MTIAILRSLQAIIGSAIDDIERVYASSEHENSQEPISRHTPEGAPSTQPDNETAIPEAGQKTSQSNSQAYASPPPSPSMAKTSYSVSEPSSSWSSCTPDFPSLDAPYDPTSLSEALTSHPEVLNAISRIVAAAGHMTATVQTPFLTLCDATMGYHLPSCMRLLEASHVVEILREAGPAGLDVRSISEKNGVSPRKLAHILRLLATHHILREVSPDVFTLNRISSLVDSGKSFAELKRYQAEAKPEMKYRDTNGIAAFVGLCSDEIQKSSAYMTETYYLSSSRYTRQGSEPGRAPFCFAFDTVKTGTGFFGWLEGQAEPCFTKDEAEDERVETGRGGTFAPTLREPKNSKGLQTPERVIRSRGTGTPSSTTSTDSEAVSPVRKNDDSGNSNRFRLERFGKAMSGTDGWETPGAVLNGFDWHSLAHGSTVVDVGGGIGSTTMLLATAFASEGLGLKFIIQDRPVVCEMGEKAWKAKCPELLNSTATFQVHDFFSPQPVRNAAVFLLRVVLHDWPDDFACKVLLQLREAASSETKLLIGDFILPLACPDNVGEDSCLEGIDGAATTMPPAPLLPNLGKASANVFWMDLTMRVMFNSQERTLRESVTLALSAGWKIIRVSRTSGSSFGYMVAIPVAVPPQPEKTIDIRSTEGRMGAEPIEIKTQGEVPEYDTPTAAYKEKKRRDDMEIIERASSRCGTPTFGSNTRLSSMQEALARFGGGIVKSKGTSRSKSTPFGGARPVPPPPSLKPALSLTTTVRKRPSPLSVPPLHGTSPVPSPISPKTITRRMSLANFRSQPLSGSLAPPPPLPNAMRQYQPLSPMSPRSAVHPPILRRASHAQLSQIAAAHTHSQQSSPGIASPSLIPVRAGGSTEPALPSSTAGQLRASVSLGPPADSQGSSRKRSGTVVGPYIASSRVNDGSPLGAPAPSAFDRLDSERVTHSRQSSTTSRSSLGEGGISVLDVAARIERGEFAAHRTPSP
ncbi:hypothetical protein M413DRAFT_18022 [Hebeloma cylindrosporum]|uniref:O-methyltransferase C-terminal domain-containing protein n=1 Tax=Hebeloma cylindrosporum TaxID=76867 RepID=A0A0C3C3M5_HEBCY|nr:hypothetical protein M413DRAFT_18022 [Hebeloma cylindrosporum h7]